MRAKEKCKMCYKSQRRFTEVGINSYGFYIALGQLLKLLHCKKKLAGEKNKKHSNCFVQVGICSWWKAHSLVDYLVAGPCVFLEEKELSFFIRRMLLWWCSVRCLILCNSECFQTLQCLDMLTWLKNEKILLKKVKWKSCSLFKSWNEYFCDISKFCQVHYQFFQKFQQKSLM